MERDDKHDENNEVMINKFIDACVVKNPKNRIKKVIVFEEYRNWWEKNEYIGDPEDRKDMFYKIMDDNFESQEYEWWCNLSDSKHKELHEYVMVK